jgi:cell division protein FtsW (lipid II flippase)
MGSCMKKILITSLIVIFSLILIFVLWQVTMGSVQGTEEVGSHGYVSSTIWNPIISIFAGLVFYLFNWERRNKWYIIIATILLILILILIFNSTGWFSKTW